MKSGLGRTRLLAFLTVGLVGATAAAAQQTLLVHLPNAPIQEADRLAQAVTTLGRLLSSGTPGLELEVKLFQRWQDAHAFLDEDPKRVSVMLTDASFLLDLPEGVDFLPSHRFVRSGQETFRRLLVVKGSNQDLRKLGDLREQSLSLVETTGESLLPFLERGVFEGDIGVGSWFGSVVKTTDDFEAVANVLYDQSVAALVSEENPLLQSHLGEDLRQVFASPRQSRPVLALRRGSWTPEQRTALDQVLSQISRDPSGREFLDAFHLDGFRAIGTGAGPLDQAALLRLPALRRKTMEIAAPVAGSVRLTLPQAPQPKELVYSLTLQLPDIPPAVELVNDGQQ